MKILEVRDGFVKIESEKKVEISSFLELKGLEKRYIAQVIRAKNNGTGYNVYAKILFVYDGMLKKYDKTLPDFSAEISEFSFDLVNNSFNYSKPIVAGKFISENQNILIDSDNFNHLTMVSIDNQEMNNIVVQNLVKQYKQLGKTIVIDMLGVLNGDNFVAGRDFKLPLNTESLQFMYEDCLNDATQESKNLIKEIFTDLAEYSKEVKFLPFITLKTIVDDMVEKSHIFKLLVFKNKLEKFSSAGYFASNPADAANLINILNSDFAVIDLSHVDNLFQNRYLEMILTELKNMNISTNVFVEASNAINKKNIKLLLYSENLKTTFITHSKFKYLSDLKPMFKNYLLENTYTNKNIFNLYSFFLESMSANNYLLVGEGTNYVPVISNLEKYEVQLQKLPQDSVSEEVLDTKYDSKVTEEIPVENIVTNEITDSNDVLEDDEVVHLHEIEQENVVEQEEIVESDDEISTPDLNEVSEDEKSDINIFEPENDSELNKEELSDINEDIVDSSDVNSEILDEKYDDSEQYSDVDDVSENDSNVQTEDEEDDVEIPQELVADFDEIENADIEDDVTVFSNNQDELEEYADREVIAIQDNDSQLGEFQELESNEIDDDDILVDLNDEDIIIEDNLNENDSLENISTSSIDQDIVEDVDKVFTTMREDTISDNDLDFIDALNESDASNDDLTNDEIFSQGDNETLENFTDEDEEGFLEPLDEISDSSVSQQPEPEILEKRESSTPIVPIYDAEIPNEDKVVSDEIEQGDTVFHAKYGSGVVEKMIKYGNKNLYSINFDNVGRRLLDPTLTEIKKA